MNILSVSNLIATPLRNDRGQAQVYSMPRFGLVMPKPLAKDMVSFKAGVTNAKQLTKNIKDVVFDQTKKSAGDLKDACSAETARKIIDIHEKFHNKNLKLFEKKLDGWLTDKDAKNYITMLERLKGIFSLQLKTASLEIGNLPNSEILKVVNDVSGFCFILENNESFELLVNFLNDMIKHGEINPIEVEYHRLPPTYKRSKIDREYSWLNQTFLQKLKNTIYDVKNPTYQLWKEVDSRSGYSGLHMVIKNSDGTKSEIQIMTRAMADLKHYENLYYKSRNGKPLDPKYSMLEPVLKPIKPVDLENLTEEEKFMQKALTKYTQEAYTERLSKPYKENLPFLKVADAKSLTLKEKELLEPYDFNKIKLLVDACDAYAKK